MTLKMVKEMIGKRFGFLLVEREEGTKKNGAVSVIAWLCKCACGNERIAAGTELRRGRIVSCGCQSLSAKKDLSGKKFGKWLVVCESPIKKRRVHWICKCDCGTEKPVSSIHLLQGTSKSCGCERPKGPDSPRFKHGSDSVLYGIWCNLIQRCENVNNKQYKDYGGRGISVCNQWRIDFKIFCLDVGLRPSPKHSIDRIDNNGNYEPGNVRWATRSEQMRNTRRNRIVEYKGKKVTLIEACESSGANYGTAKWRLEQGYSDEDALK